LIKIIPKKIDPLVIFKTIPSDKKNICFLYSFGKNGFSKLLAWDPVDKFVYNKNDSLKNFINFTKKNTQKNRMLMGYLSYDLSYELFKIKKTAKNDILIPKIFFQAFENWVVFKNKTTQIHYKNKIFLNNFLKILKNSKKSNNAIISNKFDFSLPFNNYKKSFFKVKKYIKEGDIYQINLSHRFESVTKKNSKNLFLKTVNENKVDHLAYLECDNFEILSASPERFVKITNNNIETYPIKGTIKRGNTLREDIIQKNKLLNDEKEKAELNMITDLLRNDLGKVCKINSVKLIKHRALQKCPTIWHTYSKITGKLSNNYSPIKALFSMFPGGSITGCPKKRAIEIIDELEPTTRNIYTGTIGYIHKNNIDFSIAIRTILKKKNKLYLQTGGGIVQDSKYKSELNELLLKAKSFNN
jgi:para-aminobenzoate synthetase component I